MQIIVDSNDKAEHIRLVLPLLMELAGIPIGDDSPAEHIHTGSAPGTETKPPLPPPPTSATVLPFKAPPPPPPAADTAGGPASPPAASSAAGASAAASAPLELDKAGMPWDARIHQKAKGVKKDGTWKLIKGVDTNLVQSVVAEHAARKQQSLPLPPAAGGAPAFPAAAAAALTAGAAAPVSSTVPLPPPPSDSMPLPAGTPNGATSSVSQLAQPGHVPPPPPAASGGIPAALPATGAVVFRTVLDKVTAATKDGKVTPAKVQEICQMHGAPNLMALNGMPHLLPDVNASLDAAIAGLM